jgi:hypothetical protein
MHVRKEIIVTWRITGFIAVRGTVHHRHNHVILNQSVCHSLFSHLPIKFSLVWKLLHPTEPRLTPIPLDSRGHFKFSFFLRYRFSFHFVLLYILFDENCFFVILFLFMFCHTSKRSLPYARFSGHVYGCLFNDAYLNHLKIIYVCVCVCVCVSVRACAYEFIKSLPKIHKLVFFTSKESQATNILANQMHLKIRPCNRNTVRTRIRWMKGRTERTVDGYRWMAMGNRKAAAALVNPNVQA